MSFKRSVEDNKNNTSQTDDTTKDKEELITSLRAIIEENKIHMEHSDIIVKENEETIADLHSQITELQNKAVGSLANSVDLPPDVAQVQTKLDDTLKRMKDSETKYNKDIKYWKSQAETVQNQMNDVQAKLKESEEKNKTLSNTAPITNIVVSSEEVLKLHEKIKHLESKQLSSINIGANENAKFLEDNNKLNEIELKLKESEHQVKDLSEKDLVLSKEKNELLLLVDKLNKEIEKLKQATVQLVCINLIITKNNN